jgi:type VI secretion system protein ImpM
VDVGFYGKLPSHGDFLRRRAPDGFLAAWDPWLQQCLAASRERLGDRWLDVYLTSPAWRFVAAPGACGPAGLLGLMVPSVDRVGRYFPLTVVAELPAHLGALSAATGATDFFDRAEQLLVETLEADRVDFERFDERVSRLADQLVPLIIPRDVRVLPGAATVLSDASTGRWHLPLGAGHHLPLLFDQLLGVTLEQAYQPLTLWWTEGSTLVEPSCLVVKGLPSPPSFTALLTGDWEAHRWPSAEVQVSRHGTEVTERADESRLTLRSAAASSVGRVRTVNQDSFIEHPESGLWAVADGVGGHRDGDAASRMVCDAFADFVQTGAFEETVAAAVERMQAVNDQLVRSAAASLLGDASSSTVVLLLIRGSRCAILWAGDSRAYRWREGRLVQLTRDHSVEEAGGVESHAITRAVGAARSLDLEICRDEVLPGDRFLLCSDGLTRVVSDARIRQLIEGAEPSAAVQELIHTTLEAGAPDNVTALLVEAMAEAAAKVAP